MLAAGGNTGDSGDAAAALNQLCERYWLPVYAFVRRRGYSSDEARDLTRGYLTFDESAGSYAEVAAELGVTPAAVKVAVYRLRRRYREALRRAVADTVVSDGDTDREIDGEIRFLIETLRS